VERHEAGTWSRDRQDHQFGPGAAEEHMTNLTGGSGSGSVAAPETVRLTIPAALEFVRIARLTASGVASRVGFDVDEIEDLRVAVDELSSILVEAAGANQLELAFTPGNDGITIEGRVQVDDAGAPEIDDLTRQILAAVVDDYGIDSSGGEATFRCEKRVSS
jgi:serine/threonine-protein kinase RsbW